MRVAVKVAYDGRHFKGYQVQPDARTVQGEIVRVLEKTGAATDTRAARFQSASRTDAGVSALGNVIAFDTGLPLHGILPALNAAAEDVWFLGVAEVQEEFNPRHAMGRWYRYHLLGDHDIPALVDASRLFEGRHDFSSFVKGVHGPAILTLERVGVVRMDHAVALDFVARRFLWHLVRRVVAAIVKMEEGAVSATKVKEALRGGHVSLGLAEPDPLVLMNVHHDLRYEMQPAAERMVAGKVESRMRESALAAALLAGVRGSLETAGESLQIPLPHVPGTAREVSVDHIENG